MSEPKGRKLSLDAILAEFNPMEPRAPKAPCPNAGGATITVWLSPDDKARYDRLQQLSGRRFGKKLRELIRAAIDRCDSAAVIAS